MIYEASPEELDRMRYEDQARRRYANQLARHPDPRDPDWPGHWLDEDEGEPAYD